MKTIAGRLVAVVCIGVGCGDGKETSASASTGEVTTTDEVTSSGGETEMPTTGEEAWRRICDGSQSLRLAVRRSGGGGDVPTEIGYELGSAYVYVRGDCRYWVVSGQRPAVPEGNVNNDWQFTRTGVLTPADEKALSQALHYDQWTALAGDYGSGESDGGFSVYSDGESTLWCADACSWGPGPVPELEMLNVIAFDSLVPLWDAGQPLAPGDPVQIDVFASEDVEPIAGMNCAQEWPFDLDPATVAREPFEDPSSRPIVDPELATQLRALRDAQLAENPPDPCNPLFDSAGFIFFRPSAPTTRLQLWFRDHLPLEQPDGGIPLPLPPK